MLRRPSPNHNARPPELPIDMLVLHYTGMQTAEQAVARLTDPVAEVSAHYLVDEDGSIVALADEDRRAWHAGQAFWRGHRDINARSIGIELVNPGHEFGYRPFPAAQMEALAGLAEAILARHPIPPRNVVGHSDVAPQRKQDPGELFDWAGLASRGIGLWPAPRPSDRPFPLAAAAELLALWGYDVADRQAERAALIAFQRHFRPSCCDGLADPDCLARLASLLRMVDEDI